MEDNDKQRKVDDESVFVEMTLINKGGNQRKRAIKIITKTNENNIQNSLIKFSSPQNISGTGLLTIEKLDNNDDQWLYLPALKRSRRISAANQSDSFMGTDFTYEDLSSEDLSEFTYLNLGEDTIDGIPNYKVKATPLSKHKIEESGYSHRIIWVRKNDSIISKIDFYDKNLTLSKGLTAEKIQKINSSNVSRPHMVTMKNYKTKHKTVLNYREFKVNTGISAKQFTMRSLERNW